MFVQAQRTHASKIVQILKIVQWASRTLQSYRTVHFLPNDTSQTKMPPTNHDPTMVHLDPRPSHLPVSRNPNYVTKMNKQIGVRSRLEMCPEQVYKYKQ
jgi:hypothetical protein